MPTKRVVIISDLHAGHEYSLTPPGYQRPASSRSGKFQRKLWSFYAESIRALGPIHALLVCGDAIEGKGERSGGIELLTADRHRQAEMAAIAVNVANARKVRLFRGTRYHVGRDEDFEDTIIKSIACSDASISDHDWFSCGREMFDIRHKVGSSTIPHGRHTPIARERLWNLIWNSENQRQPRATIIIRAHVHYFSFCGAESWLGITCPALCYNSSFGKRDCSGVVDVGFLVFDFDDGGYSWRPVLAKFDDLKVRPESL